MTPETPQQTARRKTYNLAIGVVAFLILGCVILDQINRIPKHVSYAVTGDATRAHVHYMTPTGTVDQYVSLPWQSQVMAFSRYDKGKVALIAADNMQEFGKRVDVKAVVDGRTVCFETGKEDQGYIDAVCNERLW